MIVPMPFRWDGDAMVPLPAFAKSADRMFVIGHVYTLTEIEERSTATHNHEFAWIKEAWQQLPEELAELYPSPEHLRKRALVQAGFYNEDIIDVGSKAGAIRVAAAFRAIDDFSVIIVRGSIIVRRTAKSQSRRAMDKAEFAASKSAIMDIIADLIGVSPETLAAQGRAA